MCFHMMIFFGIEIDGVTPGHDTIRISSNCHKSINTIYHFVWDVSRQYDRQFFPHACLKNVSIHYLGINMQFAYIQ